MLEVHPGVFVGDLPAGVRDRLWDMACGAAGLGSCILLHSIDTEQSFAIRTHGPTRRKIEDYEGLSLVRMA
jgi:CRISPR-associated protein Cas2